MIGHYLGVEGVTETEARSAAGLTTEPLIHREPAPDDGFLDLFVFAVEDLVDDWNGMLSASFPELEVPDAPYIFWEE